jgi:hypothetical protein
MGRFRIYKTKDMFLATLVVITLLAVASSFVMASEQQSKSKLRERLEDRHSNRRP